MKGRCRLAGKGFTLIELVMATTVLIIAVGGLLTIFANVVHSTVMPELLNIGAYLGEEQLERVKTLRYSDVLNQGPTPFGGNFTNYDYQVVVSPVPLTLADDPGMLNYKQVQMIVRHTTVGQVTLTTVISNH